MNSINIPISIMELFLPSDILKWFDLISGEKINDELHFTLVEKNIPPLPQDYNGEKIIFKGYRDFTVMDFPIRGKTTTLTLRRRTWKIEGSSTRLKRDIPLVAPGTTLEKEFANFLKDRG